MGLLGNILAGKQRVQIIQNNNTIIQLDASIKENHQRESPPTEFPIEDGTSISDHIVIKPFTLELTGIISDTPLQGAAAVITEAATTLTSALLPPIGLIGAAAAFSLFSADAQSSSPSVAAYNKLLAIQDGGASGNPTPVDVLTSLKRYSNMWIKSVSAPRDAETGKALIFTVSLVQLIIVQPQTVNISIFANPGLSSSQADVGEQAGYDSALKQGRLAGLQQTLGGGPN